jgi:hypothetical protein
MLLRWEGRPSTTMTTFKLSSVYRRVLDRVSREPGPLQYWSLPLLDRPRVEELISHGLLEVIKDPVKRDGLDRPIETLGITEAGRAILHPPLKPRKTIPGIVGEALFTA